MRIVAGTYRGHRLRAPAGRQVRPTQDRVREAVFCLKWVDARDAHVLDLFAGSGAMGLEALSRGARRVTFVEQDRRVARVIEENARSLALPADAWSVIVRPVEHALPGLTGPYDLILVDPPYRQGLAAQTLSRLSSAACLAPGAVIVVEAEVGTPPDDTCSTLACVLRRRYGESEITIWTEEAPQ